MSPLAYPQILKEVARGREGATDLCTDDARQLYGAMLDGGVPELELGGLLIAFRVKGESADELLGFHQAIAERLYPLRCSGQARPVVLPAYNGARRQANLTPLVAFLLRRYGIPVLLHGPLEGYGRVTAAHVLREFGVQPSATQSQVQSALDSSGLAYAPLQVLSPGLATLIGLRARLGLRTSAHTLVKMIDPFQGRGLVIGAATHPDYLERMRALFVAVGAHALLFRGTEGEPYANPKRRPRIEHIHDGCVDTLFEAEHESLKSLPPLPEEMDAKTTFAWTQKVLDGEIPLPPPIANQLACCLYASGYTADLTQAKALVAVENTCRSA